MTFKELQKELYKYMKEGENVKVETIKDIMNNAVNIAIVKNQKDNIDEKIVDAAILKSKKQTKEQIETCPSYRQDLLDYYTEKLECIELYAPKMMGRAEVQSAVEEALAALDNVNKGIAMKTVMPLLKGKAEGKDISDAVDEYLKEN